MSKVFSTALGHFKVLRSNKGAMLAIHCRLDKTAPTGDYWFQFHDLAAEPAGAADTTNWLMCAQKIQHTSGVDDFLDLDMPTDPLVGATGVTVALSTAEFTYVAAGNYAVVQGSPS